MDGTFLAVSYNVALVLFKKAVQFYEDQDQESFDFLDLMTL